MSLTKRKGIYMEKRIFISLLSLGAILVILTLAAAFVIFGAAADRQIFDVLKNESDIIATAIDVGGEDILNTFKKGETRRITLVSQNGNVIFDTMADELPSHVDRPEISEAFQNGSASRKRSSDTFGKTLYYYAVRLNDGRVLRVSAASEQVRTIFSRSLIFTVLIAGILIVAAIFLSKWLTAKITSPVRELAGELDEVGNPPDTDYVYPEFRPMLDKIRFQQMEIKRQLMRVQKEKDRIAAIINNMDEGLVILSPELRVIMLNDSAYRYLHTSFMKTECGGMLLSEVCSDSEFCTFLSNSDSKLINRDGRYLQIHTKQIEGSTEQLGRICLILDVTERTEIERIKQEFTANVSHELKTPLTSISGYAEMIENGMAKGQDVNLFATRIRRESSRMLTLISDIIKLSKLDSSDRSDEFENVELLSVCRECIDMLEMNAKNNQVTVELFGEECVIVGSKSEMTELVYNLIDNGIRYNHRGGRVTVKLLSEPVGYEGVKALLTVSDNGIGIPNEHLSRIFERFYRVDKSRSKETGGTGLGLAIVKHVAERHNARLEVDSETGQGTCVRVLFAEKEKDISDKT